MKTCTKCGMAFVRSLTHWRRDKSAADGLSRNCKTCLLEKDRRARQAIKDSPARRARTAETRKAWMMRNQRRYQRWQRAYMRQYKRDNPDVQKRYRAQLRARRLAQRVKDRLGKS